MIMLNFYRMAKMRKYVYFILGFLTFQLSLLAHAESTFKIIKQELIFPLGLIKESHASTIAEMSNGTILVSWFGGTKEGDDDVKIWQSSMTESGWSKPRVVAYGSEDGKPLPT
ncbi:exo-alpha-sialidase, partial [Escherichia coli]|nr:exo-alpha-sialidase [Escherichia coli]